MPAASTIDPVAPGARASRLGMVDAVRGYALMGLFLVHMTGYFELYNARPVDSWVQDATRILFQGKSFSLLALCFGFSFCMMMESAARRGHNFALRFGWRLALLLGIGWLHALIYRGDIIVVLAVAGLFLIPLRRIASPRMLLAVAVAILLQPLLVARILAGQMGFAWGWSEPLFYDDGGAMRASLYGDLGELVSANIVAGKVSKWSYFIETGRIFQVFGLFVAGLALGRAGFFAAPERFRRARGWALVAALAAIVPLAMARDATCCHRTGPTFFANALLSGWLDLAGMTISLLLLVAAWRWGSGRILRALVPCGRMTLTLYLGQSLVFVPLFYGFGLHLWDRIAQGEALALGMAAFAVQMAVAALWFRRFVCGPLEWLWRAGTNLSCDIAFLRRPDALKAGTS